MKKDVVCMQILTSSASCLQIQTDVAAWLGLLHHYERG